MPSTLIVLAMSETHEPIDQAVATDEEQAAAPASKKRRRTLAIIIAVVGLALLGGLLFLLNTGEVDDPTVASAEDWERSDVDVPEGGPKMIDLHAPHPHRAVVVFSADDDTCWTGFVGSKPVQECGRVIYEVANAPRSLGLNVRSTELDKRFVGLAVWDEEGETLYQSASASKDFATVALNVTLER